MPSSGGCSHGAAGPSPPIRTFPRRAEASYRFHRLRDEVAYYVAATPAAQLDPVVLRDRFAEYQDIWSQLGERWLEYRQTSDHAR